MPLITTATRSFGCTASTTASNPARPALPVGLTSKPAERASACAPMMSASAATTGGVAPRTDGIEHANPVVGLVVEDAIGERAGIVPRLHELAPPGRCEVADAIAEIVDGEFPCPRQRSAPSGLHGVEPTGRVRGTDARSERSPADLHEDPIETADALLGELFADLPAERAAAVECQRVLRPLHRERDGPGHDRLAEPQHGGVACLRRLTFAAMDASAETVEFVTEAVAHPGRHVHVDRPVGGSCERGSCERRVPARGDGERWTLGELTEGLSGMQVQQDREEVTRLLAAAHSPGFVLDPHAPTVGEAERVGQHIRPTERRRHEADSGNRPNGVIEFDHEATAGVEVHPVRVRKRRPREVLVVTKKRMGIDVVPRDQVSGNLAVIVDHHLQHVAAVVDRRMRAPPRERGGDGHLGRADGAAPAGDAHRGRHPATRALKSSIISSHTPT